MKFMSLKDNIKYVATGLACVGIFTLAAYVFPIHTNSITDSTVMVTRPDGRSGGTGVILNSYPSYSEVLTNGHVCNVVKNGGNVTTTKGESHAVTAYKKSETHDLCLLTVSANLDTSTTLASYAPPVYEHAYISGHPSLYPNVITEGHFSGSRIIDVMMGLKDCTQDDLKDPSKAAVCAELGKLPQIKRYETILVTATIMPGSSGSGVYNSAKQLGGLVFAGSGELGYAFIVPYNYVYNFINHEAPFLEYERPNTMLSVEEIFSSTKSEEEQKAKIRTTCSTTKNVEVLKVCELIKRNMIYDTSY